MKSYIKHIIPAVAAVVTLGFGLTACTGDLDVTPIDPNLQTEIDPNTLFNKCYANMALAGQSGPDGDCDIDGLDGGTTGFRSLSTIVGTLPILWCAATIIVSISA